MRKSIKVALAAILASGLIFPALGADLNRQVTTFPTTPVAQPKFEPFVGLSIGYSDLYENVSVNVNGGVRYDRFAFQIDYDHMWGNSSTITTDMNLVSATGWVMAPITIANYTFSPTAGAGIGYRWQDNQDDTVYVLGAGLILPVTSNVDLNVRYRYVADFDGRQHDHIIGTGVTFRF